MTDTLRVTEIFHSLQGEGPAAGRAATFLRLAGCNLSCTWCDTPHTWDGHVGEHTTLLTAEDILGKVADAKMLVLTGGEPLLQQSQLAFADLLDGLPGSCGLHVETNGTLEPSPDLQDRVTLWAVSPKLDNAGAHRGRQDPTLHPSWIYRAQELLAHLKFVCRDASDARHAVVYADAIGWPRHRVWLMPEGNDAEILAARWPAIADVAVAYGVNATHRLHVLAWGAERGR